MRSDRICVQGFVCGKILVALGVEVIKVERPGRDAARVISTFLHNTHRILKKVCTGILLIPTRGA